MITVRLQQLKFFGRHGWEESEKLTGNEFMVDLEVSFMPGTVKIEQIESTVNYVKLFDLVKVEMNRPRALLETLAMELLEEIFSNFSLVKTAELTITKMNPPISGFSGRVAVTYRKQR